MKRHSGRIQWPWFILLFCLAALVNTYVPTLSGVTPALTSMGKLGLTATLFLIGSGISLATLKTVGWRPLLQGVLLWIVVGVASLLLIRAGLIAY